MFKQLTPVIKQNEKVQIHYKDIFFYVKKQKLFNEIEKLCEEKGDSELYFILGTIISIKAINLKKGDIECFFYDKNFWSKRPEAIIENSVDLYNLLKEEKNFD